VKENKLRQHTTCSICDKRVCHTGLLSFWTVTIERHFIDIDAVQRQDGLAQMLNNTLLAQTMGTDADMTKTTVGPFTLTLCEFCSIEEITIAKLGKDGPLE
jgi:hypothetical protein